MGRLARVLSFARNVKNGAKVSDVKVDPGGGANVTAEHFADPGDDSHPLPDDFVVLSPASGTGRESAIGYADTLNAPKAQPGDKRIYARDADTGAMVVEVWLKNDGTVLASNNSGSFTLNSDGSIIGTNANGQFELKTSGEFNANGAKMTTDGDVVTSDGISLRDHTHAQGVDSDSNTQAETEKPT